MSGPGPRWLDRDAGPLVRPYALTRGRTRPAGEAAPGLTDVVTATGADSDGWRSSPEQRRILRLCERSATVADLASDMDLPIGVIRVLVADLAEHGLVTVTVTAGSDRVASARLLREVLNGLQAL
jgi:hypothetical protein